MLELSAARLPLASLRALRVNITNFLRRLSAGLGDGTREDFPCGPPPLPVGSGRNLNGVAARGLQTGYADLPAPCSRHLCN